MKNQYFIIQKNFFCTIIKYAYVIIICTRCKYQLLENNVQNINNILHETQITTVILDSNDPFNTVIRAIKQDLYLNNIHIIHKNLHENICYDNLNQNTLLLKILNISENHITISVFQNGTESEYQIILEIKAQYFHITNKNNYYPINISVRHTFIRDPNAILPNLIQENEILESMRIDAAQQLIQKLLIQLKI